MDSSNLQWYSCHRSDTGLVRSINEDACLDRPQRGIWVVADGMGGHAAGDVASQAIVASLKNLPPHSQSLSTFAAQVKQRLFEVNRELLQESINRGGEIIGSTVVVLLSHRDRCIYLWAGDSRIYLFRRGVLKQLSRDHSQVEELIERGVVRDTEAENLAISNYITRAVGADEELELDAEMIEPRADDLFLLCSDGLNKEVPDNEISRILQTHTLQQAAEQLIALSLKRGARDNVTVVLAQPVRPSVASDPV